MQATPWRPQTRRLPRVTKTMHTFCLDQVRVRFSHCSAESTRELPTLTALDFSWLSWTANHQAPYSSVRIWRSTHSQSLPAAIVAPKARTCLTLRIPRKKTQRRRVIRAIQYPSILSSSMIASIGLGDSGLNNCHRCASGWRQQGDLQFASKTRPSPNQDQETSQALHAASRLQACICRLLSSNHSDARQQKWARMSCSARRTSWRIRGELASVRRSSRWSSCLGDGLVLFGFFYEPKLAGTPIIMDTGSRT